MTLLPVLVAASALLGPASDSQSPSPASAPIQTPDDRVLRVYDVRDLGAVLPAARTPRPPLGQSTWLLSDRTGEPAASDQPGAKPPTALDALVLQLCSSLSLVGEPLAEGVYLVSGEREGHEHFAQLVESVRAVYSSTCVVEIAAIAVPQANAPQPGAAYIPIQGHSVLHRVSASVPRRVETRLESTDSTSFVADWTPVVSDHSVGYDPQVAGVRQGMSVLVTPGAEQGAAGSPIRLAGVLSETHMDSVSSPLVGSGPDGSLSLGLPETRVRDIAATVAVPTGKATVAAVVSGFKPDESILVVITLK